MSIPAGPQQIANVYQGNPAALQARIQNEQKQKPNITPDLAKLLALGTVTSEKDNAAKAQALQQLQSLVAQSSTGKPPTIFEQVQRKAAQMRMGLGQAAQPQAEAEPEMQGLPAALPAEEPQTSAQGIDNLPANFEFAGGGIVAFQAGKEVPDYTEDLAPDMTAARPLSLDEYLKIVEAEPKNPLKDALQKEIMGTLAQDREEEGSAAVERHRNLIGLDDLLKEKERRVSSTEELLKKQQTGRLPLWVTQLQEFSAANPRVGLGAQLGASGAGAERVRAAYESEDRAYNAEINKLKDAVLQAKIEGRYKDAAVYEAKMKDLTANHRQAVASGASLVNTEEQVEGRKQTAADAAALRKQMHESDLQNQKLVAAGQQAQRQAELDERIRRNKAEEEARAQKRLDDLNKFATSEERRWAADLAKNPEYKRLVLQKPAAERGTLHQNPEKRAKAEAELARINERIIELTMKLRGADALAVTTAPPPNAVREIKKGD